MPFLEARAEALDPRVAVVARVPAAAVVAGSTPGTWAPAPASAPEDGADEAEDDEQEEQADQQAEDRETPAEGMPAVAITVAVRWHDDRGHLGPVADRGGDRGMNARVVGGVHEKPASDRQDGDEQDGGNDATHEIALLKSLVGYIGGSDLPGILGVACGGQVEAGWGRRRGSGPVRIHSGSGVECSRNRGDLATL